MGLVTSLLTSQEEVGVTETETAAADERAHRLEALRVAVKVYHQAKKARDLANELRAAATMKPGSVTQLDLSFGPEIGIGTGTVGRAVPVCFSCEEAAPVLREMFAVLARLAEAREMELLQKYDQVTGGIKQLPKTDLSTGFFP